MKIKVTPEGRDGVWIADKESVMDFLHNYETKQIHNFNPGGGLIIGCDWDKKSVINKVKEAERIAVLTGDSFRHNLKHSLSVIAGNKLHMFDVGELTESDLLVT